MNIFHILDLFCKGLGQRINFDKSIAIASGNAKRSIRAILYNFKLHVEKVDELSYLGYPFFKSLRCSANLMTLVHKIGKKINRWLDRPLSQAIRLMIIEFILLAYPVYLMTYYKFPKKIKNLMGRLTYRFWHKGSIEKGKLVWDS